MFRNRDKRMLEITGIKCPKCNTIIYSRARHDFHWCPCNTIYIDGGFEYVKMGYKTTLPKTVKFSLEVTKKELYGDWNSSENKFGTIDSEDQIMDIVEIEEIEE